MVEKQTRELQTRQDSLKNLGEQSVSQSAKQKNEKSSPQIGGHCATLAVA